MPALHVLSPSRHRNLRWHRYQGYAFAAERGVIGLAAAELSQAALAFPLAFTQAGAGWSLCALLGLLPGQNLYVDAQGSWRGAYVPAALRAHPFHLGWDAGSAATLCVDEASGLLTPEGGEPLFDDAGALSPPVAQVWAFLARTAESILALEGACAVLAQAGVLAPWPITLQTPAGAQTVPGLHRLDEAALNALDAPAFAALRRAGALPVAYAQLLAMGNLAALGKLAQARAEAEAAARAQASTPPAPMLFLPADSSIDWDWSRIGKS